MIHEPVREPPHVSQQNDAGESATTISEGLARHFLAHGPSPREALRCCERDTRRQRQQVFDAQTGACEAS